MARVVCKNRVIVLILIALLMGVASGAASSSRCRVVFYNVENLFDCEHDEGKADRDFLPDGAYRWHFGRFKKKISHLAKTIVALSEWDSPALIGVSEVENNFVMKYLTHYSPLKELGYRYFITQSNDVRGIDVGLLYRRDLFKPLACTSYPMNRGSLVGHRTRDLLHVTGELLSGDTIEVFVTHFPSRREGTMRSAPLRMEVARRIREKIEQIWTKHPGRKVVVMGDFNDEPFDDSLRKGLEAHPMSHPKKENLLYNTHYRPLREASERNSSYKHGKAYQALDQIIVSGGFFDDQSRTRIVSKRGEVFRPGFLLTEDERYGGSKPFRTYNGRQYQGGFSDHLPVYIDWELETE